jgi:hypothetical protein
MSAVFNALFLGYALYQSVLVPRMLPTLSVSVMVRRARTRSRWPTSAGAAAIAAECSTAAAHQPFPQKATILGLPRAAGVRPGAGGAVAPGTCAAPARPFGVQPLTLRESADRSVRLVADGLVPTHRRRHDADPFAMNDSRA